MYRLKDAEKEPVLQMLKKVGWLEIKKSFENQTIILAKNLTNS